MTTQLEAQIRTTSGTGSARATRRSGWVPAIIYGGNIEPKMCAIGPRVLHKELHSAGFFTKLFDIVINGKKEQAIVRDVQLHPVTDIPLHIDFQRVNKNTTIHVRVPLVFINEDKSPGIKQGGMLNAVHHSLELICLAEQIPEHLIIDLAGLEINATVHLEDIKLPEGVKAAQPDRDNTLATIAPPAADTKTEGNAPS